jgi:uncharacterized protein YuzE
VKVSYDPQADALYFELRPLAPGTAQCRDLNEDVVADYGPDGKLAGIEILDASELLGAGLDRVILEVAPILTPKGE